MIPDTLLIVLETHKKVAAVTRWNDDIAAVALSAKTIYRTLSGLDRLPRRHRKSESSDVKILTRDKFSEGK